MVGGLESMEHVLFSISPKPIDFHIFQRGWNHQPDMFFFKDEHEILIDFDVFPNWEHVERPSKFGVACFDFLGIL